MTDLDRKLSGAQFKPPLVLVVDDDDDCREVVSILLRSHGFQVLCATNGREALDLMEGVPRPSAIVLDLMMPVMDGRQMLAAMRESKTLATIPVVVVSASHEPVATELRVSRALRKPFSIELLVAAVMDCCRSSTETMPVSSRYA